MNSSSFSSSISERLFSSFCYNEAMANKRNRDLSGARLDVPQKKQKHSSSSSDSSFLSKTTSSHLGGNRSQNGEHQEGMESLASISVSKTDREARGIPQQASSAQPQVHDPRFTENSSQTKDSETNGDFGGSSKALNCPELFQPSFGASTRQGSFFKPTKASVKFPPYNGRPSTLPPLPHILDEALESVAFTHPATLVCDMASKVNTSYDRLEFLGDAYIELMATRLLFPRFPGLSAGRLSQRREMLVKNETLAEYALAYGFDKKAKLPKAYNVPGRDNRKLWLKTLGDIFEAFVAAVIISDSEQGYQVAEAWLTALWEPKLSTPKREDLEAVDPQSKTHLAQKLMGKGIRIDYRDEAPPVEIRREGKLIFPIGVYLTGWGWEDQHLGSGKGLNKQEAGQRAAADALVNPLTAQMASVKRVFDAQLASERRKLKDGTVEKHD